MLCGDGADAGLLRSEGIESADGFVATTNEDEKNLMLAVFGKTLGAAKSLAVVKRPNYLDMTDHIPVDAIVNRNQALANIIIKTVRYPGSSKVLAVMEEISAEALELTLSQNSPVDGVRLMDLSTPEGSVIGLVERGEELLIPTGSTALHSGDKVVIFASTETMPAAVRQLGEEVK